MPSEDKDRRKPGEKLTRCYVFTSEPSGPTYDELIDFCCSIASRTALVTQWTNTGIERALEQLRPDCIKEERVSEWPGTDIYVARATMYSYAVTPRLQRALKEIVSGLFEWVGNKPEDLCFFQSDGRVILTTTAHEQDAYLKLTDTEYTALQEHYPRLASMVKDEGEV